MQGFISLCSVLSNRMMERIRAGSWPLSGGHNVSLPVAFCEKIPAKILPHPKMDYRTMKVTNL